MGSDCLMGMGLGDGNVLKPHLQGEAMLAQPCECTKCH